MGVSQTGWFLLGKIPFKRKPSCIRMPNNVVIRLQNDDDLGLSRFYPLLSLKFDDKNAEKNDNHQPAEAFSSKTLRFLCGFTFCCAFTTPCVLLKQEATGNGRVEAQCTGYRWGSKWLYMGLSWAINGLTHGLSAISGHKLCNLLHSNGKPVSSNHFRYIFLISTQQLFKN